LVLPIELGETHRSVGITQRRGALPSPGTRALIDEIRAQVDRMIKELLPVARPSSEDLPASERWARSISCLSAARSRQLADAISAGSNTPLTLAAEEPTIFVVISS
jgi:hypothetical protein